MGAAVFDKDDDLAVEFVTSAANLRSIAYNIPTQTLFAAKVERRSRASSAICNIALTCPTFPYLCYLLCSVLHVLACCASLTLLRAVLACLAALCSSLLSCTMIALLYHAATSNTAETDEAPWPTV